MSVDLVFVQAPATSGDLVFGEYEVGNSVASITGTFPPLTAAVVMLPGRKVTITGTFAPLTASIEITGVTMAEITGTFDPLTASIFIAPIVQAEITGAFQPLTAAMQAVYSSNTARPTVGQSASPWKKGIALEAGATAYEQVASALPVGWHDGFTRGTFTPSGFEHRLPSVFVNDETRYSAPLREGTGSHSGIGCTNQDADHSVRARTVGRFQDGTPLRHTSMQRHQDADHSKRGWRTVRHQSATKHKGINYTGRPRSGTRFLLGRTGRFQDGRVPPPGISHWVAPTVPTIPPGDAALLFWDDDWSTGAELLFGKTAAIVPVLTLCILPARFYMAVHTLVAHRLPDLVEVPLFDASVASDAGSFCWTLQASGPSSLFALLQPEGNVPVRLRVTLDGIAFVFAIDALNRSSVFGKTGASISGRSATALIGAPYWRAGVFSNAEERMAQQLAADALTNTGITLDWGIGAGVDANGGLVDWLVPAGAWSFQGTPLAAVQQIAQAAGGYLQSHRSAATLLTRHPYGTRALDAPGAPWGWSTGAADVELATDALITEAITRADGADINAVYVSGTTQGVLGLVKRTGSAADKLASMVSDPLITEAVAARQRGLAILGAAGHKHSVRLDLPVLTGQGQPGILDVGQLVQVNTATPWRGRVRAVNVASNWPSLRQSVTIERHLEVA